MAPKERRTTSAGCLRRDRPRAAAVPSAPGRALAADTLTARDPSSSSVRTVTVAGVPGHSSAAMASAVASTFWAVSTWRFSMSRPSRVATPRPSAWAASNAAMTASARSTSSAPGAKTSLHGLDLTRVDQRLAVEAHLAALARLGEEALGVPDVVEDPVDDGHAGGPGREQPRAAARPGSPPDPARRWRRAPCRGRWCRARGRRAGRTPGRSPRRAAPPPGSRPWPTAGCARARPPPPSRPRASAPRRPSRPWARRSRPVRQRRRRRGRRRATAEPIPLTRIVSSRRP